MIHRHLEYDPRTPVPRLPAAAIADILDRGDLSDWRPIAAEVGRDPYGPLAERVLQLVNAYPMYGTSPLWRFWIDRCRARDDGRQEWRREKAKLSLAAIRKHAGLTQVELATRLGISQSDLSKLERRGDMRVSTLREYARAVGAEIHILLDFGEKTLEADASAVARG